MAYDGSIMQRALARYDQDKQRRADELEQVGLDIPQVTKVALILRQRGLPVDTAVYTVEALRDALLRLKGGDAVC